MTVENSVQHCRIWTFRKGFTLGQLIFTRTKQVMASC